MVILFCGVNKMSNFEYNIVKQKYNKCFTNRDMHDNIKLQKRSDDYGTGND